MNDWYQRMMAALRRSPTTTISLYMIASASNTGFLNPGLKRLGSRLNPYWLAKGPWNVCHTPGVRLALLNRFFDSIGLPRLERGQNI